ncbi:UDP-N-acetylglucosamine 2-epimerase (non-hydrolyzing) [Sphingomonas changnyeongensis]|uniref:UDP-N-acetylglucosamine 2-epimerase (non-hydrolyzing) n=1 Tax=Sphingomonas changnyeongensis TaxID=2698679 RepID=A0A7Z2NX96_9SPHN|nr:UDP-N-acetylglucosamine 2-epimerase (non-hydrolyzing) [Sphingomonas changnyeongensis]
MARIMFIFGTRPEAIKLAPLILAMRDDIRFDVSVCFTGQHRDLACAALQLFGIVADHALDLMVEGQPLDILFGRLLAETGAAIDRIAPDQVIVQGDTASALAGALAAHYRQLPVAHVEAGLRSGSLDHPWPEEAHRRMIATVAGLHFAPTRRAVQALLDENVPAARVHLTGNTVIDALEQMRDRLRGDPSLGARGRDLVAGAGDRPIVLTTCHRRETLGEPLAGITMALRAIAARGAAHILMPVHPAPEVRRIITDRLADAPGIRLVEPLDYASLLHVLDSARLVLTDSGGLQEEAPAMGVPVLILRETTERTEAIDAGAAELVGRAPERIIAAAMRHLGQPGGKRAPLYPFGTAGAARRISELLAAARTRSPEPAYADLPA